MAFKEIKMIRSAIKKKEQQWSAGLTSLSELSEQERKKRLGLVMEEKEMVRMTAAMAREDALAACEGIAFTYPAKWDWRDVFDRDWTTPIKDQGTCGSCVAFATVATVESNLEIFRRKPHLNPNLSEADLFYCGCGKCCLTGWNFAPALNYARDKGIPDDACFPYTPGNQACKSCRDRSTKIVKIQEWREICNVSEAKEWVYRKGPVITGMEVYADFFSYRGGIYRHAYGDYEGLHAISVVGYNDPDRYWICKNSWGTGWGENGWFKIAYDECGIGRRFCFYDVEFPSRKDDIIVPKSGKVVAKFKSKAAAFDNELRLHKPVDKLIFKATNSAVGRSFNVGTFSAGTRLVFALKTPQGFTYFTDHSLNTDACDHAMKVRTGIRKWELRWEDLYGLGDRDYNDVVVEIEIA